MTRYTIYIATILATAATAIASVNPATHIAFKQPQAITIAYKAADMAPKHKLVLAKCALEDCSDTPQL